MNPDENNEDDSFAGDTTSVSTNHLNDPAELEDDPHALLSLKILRLAFLDIGPLIENLDICA